MAGGADTLASRVIVNPADRLRGEQLARFRSGDVRVFRGLVDALSPRLLAIARSFAVDGDDAHDLVQEAWQRAFARREDYTGRGTLVGWILAILRSVCLKAVSSRASAARRPTAASIGDPAPDPLSETEQADLARAVHEALLELPDRERDVVYLRFIAQRSTRETAETLGCAEGTVKATLNHAMKKLQRLMKVWSHDPF